MRGLKFSTAGRKTRLFQGGNFFNGAGEPEFFEAGTFSTALATPFLRGNFHMKVTGTAVFVKPGDQLLRARRITRRTSFKQWETRTTVEECCENMGNSIFL